jgi:O-succinylbenzoate synthase
VRNDSSNIDSVKGVICLWFLGFLMHFYRIVRYGLQYRLYRRRFVSPVRFGLNLQDFRQGIILRLECESGEVAFAEVAPVEVFGSESVEKSAMILKSHHGVIRRSDIEAFDHLEYPCTAYALQDALEQIDGQMHPSVKDSESVPSEVQTAVLTTIDQLQLNVAKQKKRTPLSWKLKIDGSEAAEFESYVDRLKAVILELDSESRLRLDANESLSQKQAVKLLEDLEPYAEKIEFIEQPLDRLCLEELNELKMGTSINIALDESVGIIRNQYSGIDFTIGDWIWILKPSLGDMRVAGALSIPSKNRVISSVFETAIGFSRLLRFEYGDYLPGLGTQQYFDSSDGMAYPSEMDGIIRRISIDEERIWQRLG